MGAGFGLGVKARFWLPEIAGSQPVMMAWCRAQQFGGRATRQGIGAMLAGAKRPRAAWQ